MPKHIMLPCEELYRLYVDELMSTVILSRIFGCSVTTVANHLRRCGVSLRDGRFRARVVSPDELMLLYADDALPVREIACYFGVSVSTIYNRLHALDMPLRRARSVCERRTVRYRLRPIRLFRLAEGGAARRRRGRPAA